MLIFEKFGIILFFVLLLFVFGCVEQNDENLIPEEVNLEESISVESDFNESVSLRIATWNLQIFGQKKASNSELLSYYLILSVRLVAGPENPLVKNSTE